MKHITHPITNDLAKEQRSSHECCLWSNARSKAHLALVRAGYPFAPSDQIKKRCLGRICPGWKAQLNHNSYGRLLLASLSFHSRFGTRYWQSYRGMGVRCSRATPWICIPVLRDGGDPQNG